MVFDMGLRKDTKTSIIHILDKYGSLPAKKIFNRLKKELGLSITYQATHKALKKMCENEVLKCEDNHFMINPHWISKMKSFINQLEKQHHDIKAVFAKLDAGKTVNFTVRNDMEMGYFVLDFAHYYNSRHSKEEGPFVLNFHFMWTILPLSDAQFVMFKEIVDRRGVYATSHEISEYERIMKRHWERAGAHVAIDVPDCVSNSEVVVLGDYIINIFWDPDHLKMNIDFTKTVKDEPSFDYNRFYKILGAHTKTEFVIVKNKDVAEKLRKKTLSYFKV